MKKCNKCGIEKEFSQFTIDKKNRDGFGNSCKICRNKHYTEWRKNNKDDIYARDKIWRENNKELKREYNKRHVAENKDYYIEYQKSYYTENKDKLSISHKQYYERNKDDLLIYSKDWRLENREYLSGYFKEYRKNNKDYINSRRRNRLRNDTEFKIYSLLRTRIWDALTKCRGIKSIKSIELLGCSIEHCRKHLESQFKEGMSWDNHGLKGWHIDHIKPCASFDLTDIEEQKKCFNYSNLQPLWAIDNLKKGDRLTY
jgi:hypothetical protein